MSNSINEEDGGAPLFTTASFDVGKSPSVPLAIVDPVTQPSALTNVKSSRKRSVKELIVVMKKFNL